MDTIEKNLDEYPYFVLPYIDAYRSCTLDQDDEKKLRDLIAANIGDKEIVDYLIGVHNVKNVDSHNSSNESNSNFETINSFIEKFGGCKKTGGYEISTSDQIQKGDDSNDQDELKDLIKNHKYIEAIEIIERQNLNNPQKNIYFADQIRFLRKLMAIENRKLKSQG